MTSGNENPRKRGNPGCANGCLGTLCILLLILGVLLAAVTMYVEGVEDETKARLQAIRDAGEPASLADLDAWIGPVADEDNAAIPLQRAIDRLWQPGMPVAAIPFVSGVKAPKSTEPVPEGMKAAIAVYLEQEDESLGDLSEAAQRPYCRFPLNYAMGYATDLSHLNSVRALQQTLTVKAIYESASGKADESFQTMLVGARLSEAFRQEPFLYSQYTRMSMHSLFVISVEQCLARTTHSSGQLKQIQDEIKQMNTGDCIYTGLLGERCLFLDAFASVGT
ncbi:MAG: hypothetical protein WC655_02330, partial [Candidatus Hydrogenedentales bacterium]